MNPKLLSIIVLLVSIFGGFLYMKYYSIEKPVKTSGDTFEETMFPLVNNFGVIGVEEFRSEIDSGETILIDIRTSEEQEQYGIISNNQKHIVFGPDSFSEQILELDRNKKYLIYCWHGNRSGVARDFMRDNGFTWVKDLAGGIDDWNKSNVSITN